MSRILIIDDEPAIGWSLREILSDEGHSVEVAASVEAGLEACSRFYAVLRCAPGAWRARFAAGSQADYPHRDYVRRE